MKTVTRKMFTSGKKLVLYIPLLFFFASAFAGAQTAEEIISKVEDKESSDGSRMIMEMKIYSSEADRSSGKEFVLEVLSRGTDDSYMEFIEPRSVRGLRVLSLGRDNWLYFPSTGRVRKIAGSARGDSVQGIGGDFSYEDLGSGNWRDSYTFTLTSSDAQSYVLDGMARESDSVYSQVTLTIDRKLMLPRKISYHTRKDGHLKDLILSDFRNFDGKMEASRMEMKNLKKGSLTVVEIREADYSRIPDSRYFNPTRFYR